MENPLAKPPPPKKPEIYPITVKCIVDCLSDTDPDIVTFRDYAHSLNINFLTREYDSRKYSEDRDYITRLPAFHIYVKKQYRETFYPNTRPYQIMQNAVEAYKIKQHERLNRRTWVGYYREMKIRLVALFHRKTAMEKYQEEKAIERTRRISNWA